MCNKIYLLSYLIVARVSGVMLRFRYSISGICKRESGRNLQKWRMIIMVNGREWTATVMEWHRLLREYVKWAIVQKPDPRLQRPATSASHILAIGSVQRLPVSQGQESASCILTIGSGQRILYRLGSGLWLVPVLVMRRSRFLNDSREVFQSYKIFLQVLAYLVQCSRSRYNVI